PTHSTLCPYTTLFRSSHLRHQGLRCVCSAARSSLHPAPRPIRPQLSGSPASRADALIRAASSPALVRRPNSRATRHFRGIIALRSEEHTSELQSRENL